MHIMLTVDQLTTSDCQLEWTFNVKVTITMPELNGLRTLAKMTHHEDFPLPGEVELDVW
jgi:hypothetical protein